jgi:hypothetical protein
VDVSGRDRADLQPVSGPKSVIGAQQSVATGPVVVNQSNIGDLLPSVDAGLR